MVTTWTMPHYVREHPMYHLSGSRAWYEDSPAGIRAAARGRWVSADLNMLWTRPDPNCPLHDDGDDCAGHEWNLHWPRPLRHGWADPQGKIPRRRHVKRMTTAEVLRIHPKGHPKVHPQLMEHQIARLGFYGLHGSLEAKGRFGWSKARMRRLYAACVEHRVPALVKSAWTRPLRHARAAGFQTRYTKDHRRGM